MWRWRSSTRVFLQPVAAPSVLGLFGFAGATFMVAANLAGWYGTPLSGVYLFPFAAMVGGIAQFAAGLWAYKARDALATAMHGMWGAFWLAYGLLWLLVAAHDITFALQRFGADHGASGLGNLDCAVARIVIVNIDGRVRQRLAKIGDDLGNGGFLVITGYENGNLRHYPS